MVKRMGWQQNGKKDWVAGGNNMVIGWGGREWCKGWGGTRMVKRMGCQQNGEKCGVITEW